VIALNCRGQVDAASVNGSGEDVKCRRNDEGAEPERNTATEPLTEANASAFSAFRARDERAGNEGGGPERY
jgi:hypothetical protein